MNVLALRGRHDSGKSTTLIMLYHRLFAAGYKQVPGYYRIDSGGADIFDVLDNGTQKIGIVTRGDVGTWLDTDLKALDAAGSHKAICACRLWGYTNTHAVNYHPHAYIPKTLAPTTALFTSVNNADAATVFALI